MKPARIIETNGMQVYFSFGMSALASFCESEGITLQGLSAIGNDMSPIQALRMIWHGMRDGYRREGKEFTYTIEDVGDMIDDDPELMQNCMDVIANSMPGSNAEKGNAKAANRKASR